MLSLHRIKETWPTFLSNVGAVWLVASRFACMFVYLGILTSFTDVASIVTSPGVV